MRKARISAEIRAALADPSTKSLILANAFTLFWALFGGWGLHEVMLIYWSQSVLIGFVNVFRILALRDYSTEGVKVDGRPVKPTIWFKVYTAGFFAVHYGLFHLVYFMFLGFYAFASKEAEPVDPLIVLPIGMFFANHVYSFIHNRRRDEARLTNIGYLMFKPYIRIFPMHLSIIFGGVLSVPFILAASAISAGAPDSAAVTLLTKLATFAGLTLFLSLKTVSDVIAHRLEHEWDLEAWTRKKKQERKK